MNRPLFTIVASLVVISVMVLPGCATREPSATSQAQTGERQMPDDAKAISDVRAVLDEQAAAWNRGDIAAFMDGYLRSDETTFVSGDTVTRGWQTVLDRYKRNYDSREKMGTLAFSELDIKTLDADTARALGRWQLTRAGDTPHGRFTLLFRRTPQGWRIFHDHTSAAS